MWPEHARSYTQRGAENARTTIFVAIAADCVVCPDVLEFWRKLLDDEKLWETVTVRIATVGRTAPSDAVRSLFKDAAPVHWAQVHDVERFVLRTGINAVPMTLIVDAKDTVVAGVAGTPSRTTGDAVRALLSGRRNAVPQSMLVERVPGTVTRLWQTPLQ